MVFHEELIESVVIVRGPHEYHAYLRFTDPTLNENICRPTKWAIHEEVERVLWRRCAKQERY